MTAERGTHGYMAPEVYDGVYSEAADVFSLSITFFEVVNLKRAYTGSSFEIMRKMDTKAKPESFSETCPEELRPIIEKGMNLNAEKRPTIGVICQDLNTVKSGDKFLIGQLKVELNAKNAA